MFKTHKKSKMILATLTAIAIVGGGSAAIGFWSGSGGSGSTTLLVGNTSVTVNTRALASPITTAQQALSGTFSNQSNAAVTVNSVVATIGTVTRAIGVTLDCSAADFTLSGAQTALQTATVTLTTPVVIPRGGSNYGSWSGIPIALLNSATVDQSGCKGATVTINYTTT